MLPLPNINLAEWNIGLALQGNDTNISYALSQNWARIWKVNKTTIQAFLAVSNHTLANTPTIILEWPAKGNMNAKGKNNAVLNITEDMAPFVDVNSDGIYNALQGDYPKIKGDQMLWLVYNDAGPTPHTEIANTPAIGVEVKMSIYGYHNYTSIDNLLFYELQLRNKKQTLDSFTVGTYIDFDLGYPKDDYIGYDSSRNMGYVYNSVPNDSSGNTLDYRDSIPMAAIRMLEFPGNDCNNFMPLGSFMYFRNSNSTIYGNPKNGQQVYGYLNHTWLENTQAKAPSSDPLGVYCDGWQGTGQKVKYVFDGKNYWDMCSYLFPAEDYRMVMAITPQTFHKDSSMKLAFAIVATERIYHNACPSYSLNALNAAVNQAKLIYCNPIISAIGNTSINNNETTAFPNPATNTLTIRGNFGKETTIKIYNPLGQEMLQPITAQNKEVTIDVTQLPIGLYLLQLVSPEKNTTIKFFKN